MASESYTPPLYKFPPSVEHERIGDAHEWRKRGTGRVVGYTCVFCPARGDHPDGLDHAGRCPITRISAFVGWVCLSTFSMPYGGMDWSQREGFTIREIIEESTERAVHRVLDGG